jgi:hypothetical protein
MWPNRHLVAEEDDGTLSDIFTQPTLGQRVMVGVRCRSLRHRALLLLPDRRARRLIVVVHVHRRVTTSSTKVRPD